MTNKKAIPFHSSVRIMLSSAGKIRVGNDIIGMGIKAKVYKNKLGPPFRETVFNMYFDKGLIQEEAWLDYLKDYGIAKQISAQKSAIEFKGEAVEFKNREFAEFIKDNIELRKFCLDEIKKRLYVEQDPSKRTEEIVLEEMPASDEM